MSKKGMTPEKAAEVKRSRGLGKATKLGKMRIARGLSQNELAEASNVPKKTIQHYEQGTHSIDGAKLNTLCDLSLALDCEISDIIESDELIEKFNKTK